jgi:hypothetical protein
MPDMSCVQARQPGLFEVKVVSAMQIVAAVVAVDCMDQLSASKAATFQERLQSSMLLMGRCCRTCKSTGIRTKLATPYAGLTST